MNIAVIDHYDSFSHLLCDRIASSLKEQEIKLDIFRGRDEKILEVNYDLLVLSPGPMSPSQARLSMKVLKQRKAPVLGVCLGMQIINEFLGGKTIPSKQPLHGHTVMIETLGHPVFKQLPSRFYVARYNSLTSKINSTRVDIIAFEKAIPPNNSDKEVMAIVSKQNSFLGIAKAPSYLGFQFHPESFQTEYGQILLKQSIAFLLG